MRKWVPNGELESDRTEWAVILNAEEFEALEELLRYTVRDRRRRTPVEPEPIEVGQVWVRDSGEVVEVYEVDGDSIGIRMVRDGDDMGHPNRRYLREHYKRLPFRREPEAP